MGFFGKEFVYVGSLTIFLIYWLFKPKKLTKQDSIILALFCLITFLHLIIFGTIVLYSSIGFLIKLTIALLAVRLIPEFSRHYISVMYVLSLVSFIFFTPLCLGVDMQSLFSAMRIPLPFENIHFTIGLHNLRAEYGGSIRNMGMFWEPGAFAGYLLLALFFVMRDGPGDFSSKHKMWVLIVALLTTQSTTGYMTLIMVLVLFAIQFSSSKSRSVKILLLPLLLALLVCSSFIAFKSIDFLGDKIKHQINSVASGQEASKITRFGNFVYDLDWIAQKPILGWSSNPQTRLDSDPDVLKLVAKQGNGLTGFTIRFGLLGTLVFFSFVFFNTWRITGSPSSSLVGLVIISMLLMGEQFLNFPLFLTLMFFSDWHVDHSHSNVMSRLSSEGQFRFSTVKLTK